MPPGPDESVPLGVVAPGADDQRSWPIVKAASCCVRHPTVTKLKTRTAGVRHCPLPPDVKCGVPLGSVSRRRKAAEKRPPARSCAVPVL